jgi:ACT domain-containing protein
MSSNCKARRNFQTRRNTDKLIDQIQVKEIIHSMAKVEKKDCMDIESAVSAVGTSRQTLYNYLNALSIQRYRFPFDRKTYILRSDVERIKEVRAEASGDSED